MTTEAKVKNNKVQVSAKLRYLKISPRKVRLVADIIRGLPVEEAEAQLLLSGKRASADILKLLKSAVANAKHNYQIDASKLYIKKIKVDKAPVLKRWMPRASGSVSMIQKRMSHVVIELGEVKKAAEKKFIIPKKERKEARKETKKAFKEKEKKAEGAAKSKSEAIYEKKPEPKQGVFRRIFRRKSI